ncbi:hypothetical protein [Paenibacillus tianjinensis]|uniref:Uncharacterized protein n=1 Tax=Paenibacillus tianjinensis TaxID=2810347 RepID=A0ABX7L626_9BACL|nr:hypothetical protein [Paenibacillus tianjinensis]QSF43404.1 hypothetical protein JRJ22_19250 [Paenibacillus tianjinensis]
MSTVQLSTSDLKLTEDENAARYIEILSNKFGSKLTIGGIYEIKRSYGSPQIYGDDGEMYIVDEDGKDAYGFQMLCDVNYYE